jgi:hypothetical protein
VRGNEVCIGIWKAIRGRCMECGKFFYNRCPLMCEVIGVSVMVEIHYNSHKWSNEDFVGRLVVVIDVNPSHGFWTARLLKVFGNEGKCTCRYNTHGWIVHIMFFPVVCGTSCGSSWLRRN